MVKIPNILFRLFKYSFVSFFATILDLLILYSLLELFSWHYLVPIILSFLIAHSINYFVNRKWAFIGTNAKHAKSYLLFMLFGMFSLFVILPVTYFVTEFFKINPVVSRGVASLVSGIINFSLNYFISFEMKKHFKNDIKMKH